MDWEKVFETVGCLCPVVLCPVVLCGVLVICITRGDYACREGCGEPGDFGFCICRTFSGDTDGFCTMVLVAISCVGSGSVGVGTCENKGQKICCPYNEFDLILKQLYRYRNKYA